MTSEAMKNEGRNREEANMLERRGKGSEENDREEQRKEKKRKKISRQEERELKGGKK